MGYAKTDPWGNNYEVLAGFGIHTLLTTVVVADVVVGAGAFPTSADLNFGQVVGAYLDLCIPSFENTFAGANWILADAGYPTVTIVPTGHGAIDGISNLTSACYGNAQGSYSYNWIYGDTNFGSIFTPGSHYYGHAVAFRLHNIRSQQDELHLNNMIFRFRFYVR